MKPSQAMTMVSARVSPQGPLPPAPALTVIPTIRLNDKYLGVDPAQYQERGRANTDPEGEVNERMDILGINKVGDHAGRRRQRRHFVEQLWIHRDGTAARELKLLGEVRAP
jgi:hypothetical protein